MWDEVLLEVYMRRYENSVLEVGTGFGHNLELLKRAFREAFIVTLDPEPIKVEGAHFVQGVAESLPFRDESFDLLATATTMHHVDDVEKALQEFRRVLKCRGRIVIMDWTPNSRYNPHGPERVAKSMDEIFSLFDLYFLAIDIREEEDFYVICGAKLCT